MKVSLLLGNPILVKNENLSQNEKQVLKLGSVIDVVIHLTKLKTTYLRKTQEKKMIF